jgi:NAD(P)-dependent dehydrogenase (short-subunit alcohol dehydrogenase family)
MFSTCACERGPAWLTMPRMRDREVLVTGGGGGLGLFVTREIVARGARVTATTFAPGEGEQLEGVTLVQADLRREEDVARVVSGMKRIDALVHMVGGFAMGDTREFSLQAYRDQIDLNLTSTFLTVRAALKPMRAAGFGRIVTVASRVALEPAGSMAVYSATKAAVLAFTRAVAEECRGTGVTANSVLPSVIDTPGNRKSMGEENADKWVKPENLAKTIAFLCSEEAGDLRGTAVQAYAGV